MTRALDVPVASGLGRLEELYVRHVDDALRVAYLLTGDRQLAQDIAQDAFVRVAGRWRHIRDQAAFPAYLRRTVVNLAHNHFRHRVVERRYLESHPPPGSTSDPDPADRDELRRALLTLPVRQRAAIVLRFYEDLSETDTALALDCAPGTVKSLVSRGMQTLRQAVTRDA